MAVSERANADLHPHFIDKITPLLRGQHARIAEIGCGFGAMLLRLSATGYSNLHGIDIVRLLKRCAGIEFSECDLGRLEADLDNKSVDLIVSVGVFEQIEKLGSLLGGCFRCCVRRGEC